MGVKQYIAGVFMAVVFCWGAVVSAAEIDEAQRIGDELKQKKEATEKEKASLENDLEKVTQEMMKTNQMIADKEAEILQTENDLVNAKIEENNQYEDMKKRIRYMYENGDNSFVEILCKSKTISDFLNNAEYINAISTYDRQMLTAFQATVKRVEEKEKVLQREYEELAELQDQVKAQEKTVKETLAKTNTQLADLDKKIGENAALVSELLAEAERQRLARIEYENSLMAEPRIVGDGDWYSPEIHISGNGQFAHPCPGGFITSYYGEYRSPSDPAHKGMDFGADTGTPTYAADDGTVLIAGYSSSAGNWVVINHGDGLVTKYMHHAAIYVSPGQRVVKGEQIGSVGSTGWSTGPHLHFQVEVDGRAVNPQYYL